MPSTGVITSSLHVVMNGIPSLFQSTYQHCLKMYWIRARAENSHWVLTRRLQFDSKEVLLHTQLSCPKDIASGTGIIPYVYAYINTLRNSIHPMSERIIQANVMLIPVTAAVTSFVRQSRHSITKHTIALLCKHPTESPQLHIIWSIITKYHHISHGDIVNKRWSIVHEKLLDTRIRANKHTAPEVWQEKGWFGVNC